ncbi:MAG TPA: sulfatase-like hydrolase/transferase, partial [Planctomycetaceae bacterium]|nr:sulfatase-like hydrolase/transferase [Planctomycetaceae bacterium]
MTSLPLCFALLLFVGLFSQCSVASSDEAERPNILFAIADDWGWPHASAYGDPVVNTPTFDRLAKEGILFHHAYISSPSCTPSRGAILTGQWHWRLEGAGNLWSVFPDKFATYPEQLAEAGYATGQSGKGWGPGRTETQGRELAGKRDKGFRDFLKDRDKRDPFCYWLGSSDPHRPYKLGSGKESGMNI